VEHQERERFPFFRLKFPSALTLLTIRQLEFHIALRKKKIWHVVEKNKVLPTVSSPNCLHPSMPLMTQFPLTSHFNISSNLLHSFFLPSSL